MNPYIKIVALGKSGQKIVEKIQKQVESAGFAEVDCISYDKSSGCDSLRDNLSLAEDVRWRLLLLVGESGCGFKESEIQEIVDLAVAQGYLVGFFSTESLCPNVHSVAFHSVQALTDMADRIFDFVRSLRMSGFVNLDFADVAAMLRRKDGSASQLNYSAAKSSGMGWALDCVDKILEDYKKRQLQGHSFLVHVEHGREMTLMEYSEVIKKLGEVFEDDCDNPRVLVSDTLHEDWNQEGCIYLWAIL